MNLFPFDATMPDGRVVKTARIVTDGRSTAVWSSVRAARAAGVSPLSTVDTVALISFGPGQPVATDGKGYTLATDAGEVILTPKPGCGCGHPLKRYTPPMPGSDRAGRQVS